MMEPRLAPANLAAYAAFAAAMAALRSSGGAGAGMGAGGGDTAGDAAAAAVAGMVAVAPGSPALTTEERPERGTPGDADEGDLWAWLGAPPRSKLAGSPAVGRGGGGGSEAWRGSWLSEGRPGPGCRREERPGPGCGRVREERPGACRCAPACCCSRRCFNVTASGCIKLGGDAEPCGAAVG